MAVFKHKYHGLFLILFLAPMVLAAKNLKHNTTENSFKYKVPEKLPPDTIFIQDTIRIGARSRYEIEQYILMQEDRKSILYFHIINDTKDTISFVCSSNSGGLTPSGKGTPKNNILSPNETRRVEYTYDNRTGFMRKTATIRWNINGFYKETYLTSITIHGFKGKKAEIGSQSKTSDSIQLNPIILKETSYYVILDTIHWEKGVSIIIELTINNPNKFMITETYSEDGGGGQLICNRIKTSSNEVIDKTRVFEIQDSLTKFYYFFHNDGRPSFRKNIWFHYIENSVEKRMCIKITGYNYKE
ncbi:MAG: hypothetical protein ACK4K0_09505 [Flavobacteriales bacterium]